MYLFSHWKFTSSSTCCLTAIEFDLGVLGLSPPTLATVATLVVGEGGLSGGSILICGSHSPGGSTVTYTVTMQ